MWNTKLHGANDKCVGYEPTILASERTKTVHTLDRSATMTGYRLRNILIRHLQDHLGRVIRCRDRIAILS
jgi:hypothetical protein